MGHDYLTQKFSFKKLKAFEEDEICLYTDVIGYQTKGCEKRKYRAICEWIIV